MVEPSPFGIYLDLLRTFERLNIPYVIIGAFAGMSYGVTRLTADVDIVVDINERHIESLAAAYPSPRFYADPLQMRDSIQRGIMFNIIDAGEGRKADLIPLTMKPGYGFALKRRVRREISLPGENFSAWFARPDDVVVGKLMAWREGHSSKHEQDIRDILSDVRLADDPELKDLFDWDYVRQWVLRLGPDVQNLWKNLQAATGTNL